VVFRVLVFSGEADDAHAPFLQALCSGNVLAPVIRCDLSIPDLVTVRRAEDVCVIYLEAGVCNTVSDAGGQSCKMASMRRILFGFR
jgi:hypothetical protein